MAFDGTQLDGARAVASRRHPAPAFLTGPLPPLDRPTLQLASLIRFVEHPVKAFLRERLGFYAGDVPEISVALRVELAPLERWGVGERLLEACLSGVPWDRAVAAEKGRGLLPPGPAGDVALQEVAAVVSALLAGVEALPCGRVPAAAVEVNMALPDGRRLVGTVPGTRDGTVVRCTFSKLAPKHRLRAWAQLLALSAAHPELVPSAVTIGQAETSTAARPRLSVSALASLGEDASSRRSAALPALEALVDLYDRGMREPLPVYCATSAAWAAAARRGEDPLKEARPRWASVYDEIQGEGAEPEHQLVLGAVVPFDQLLAVPPAADESGPGWAGSETARLGRLARRLWDPVLAHERLAQ